MEKQLPDTPWHVGYAKKHENDPRRHKSRCIHNTRGVCMSSQAHYYMESCGGSSHCEIYSETVEDYKRILEERKTAEEIEIENVAKYKASLSKKKKKLATSANAKGHMPTSELRRCLVCDEAIQKIEHSLKKCSYCGMYYVDIQESTRTDILDIIKADEVFLMNISKPKEQKTGRTIVVHPVCNFANKENMCMNPIAQRYEQKCKEKNCVHYKRNKPNG